MMNIVYMNLVGGQNVDSGKRSRGRFGGGSAGQYSSMAHFQLLTRLRYKQRGLQIGSLILDVNSKHHIRMNLMLVICALFTIPW